MITMESKATISNDRNTMIYLNLVAFLSTGSMLKAEEKYFFFFFFFFFVRAGMPTLFPLASYF